MIDYVIESKAINYIIKPFREEQIITALKLAFIVEHEKCEQSTDIINLKYGFRYDLKSKLLLKSSGESIVLRGKKRELLYEFVKNINQAIPYKQLIDILYGDERSMSALRTQISRFNKNLGVTLIENVNGVGYKLSSVNKR